MPDVEQYTPGTPSWVDLSSPDAEASAAFYSGLFGWDVGEAGDLETTGGYRMFSQGGRTVAGLGGLQAGAPPHWKTYVSVADADATTEAVKAAGGAVYLEPMDVLDAGRMAVFADPQGAVFAVWQPGLHTGSGIVNEPVSLAWNELGTTDTGAAAAFYTTIFGWDAQVMEMPGMDYTMLSLGDQPIAGMRPFGAGDPPGIVPHWLTYFSVADCAASMAKIRELGGTVHIDPVTVPAGTFTIASDPQRAVFAIIEAPAAE